MATDYKFEGWMGLDAESANGNMVWQEFEPKRWEETDVDIKVTNSGICGSDLHTLRSGWVSSGDPSWSLGDARTLIILTHRAKLHILVSSVTKLSAWLFV